MNSQLFLKYLFLLIILSSYQVTSLPDIVGWWKNYSVISSTCSLVGRECCRAPFVRPPAEAISILRSKLKEGLFGQHLAIEIVLNTLESHLNDENAGKALVLSFHGWVGSGKSYLAELIMDALYQKGTDSHFVKYYRMTSDFPDPLKVIEYQEKLGKDIGETISRCEKALFIFDELDKTPGGVFDALSPYIEHPGKKFRGNNYKQSIFIFISNSGGPNITKITFDAWKDGRRREELTFKDFQSFLELEAFNTKDQGLYKSRLVDKYLVDFFIPFLPLQRTHVISCALVEMKRQGFSMDPDIIADGLNYWPEVEKLYSRSGCKRVEPLVKFYLAKSEILLEIDESDGKQVEDEYSNDEL